MEEFHPVHVLNLRHDETDYKCIIIKLYYNITFLEFNEISRGTVKMIYKQKNRQVNNNYTIKSLNE